MSDSEFSKDTGLLQANVCWVIFRFPDGTIKLIRTTLRKDILEGVEAEDSALYDLDRQRWFKLDRVAGSSIEIYLTMPKLREVDLFANQFIV